jgi:hypothetical protein
LAVSQRDQHRWFRRGPASVAGPRLVHVRHDSATTSTHQKQRQSASLPGHDVQARSSAERRWRTLDDAKILPDAIKGISFKDGTRSDQAAA